jgi:hypothetical protein
MLSGIGDTNHLKEVGVKPLVHLPGVGAELWDHPTVIVGPFIVESKLRSGDKASFLWQRDHTQKAIELYKSSAEGPLSSCLWSGYGLYSTSGNHSYPNIIYEQWAQGNFKLTCLVLWA